MAKNFLDPSPPKKIEVHGPVGSRKARLGTWNLGLGSTLM